MRHKVTARTRQLGRRLRLLSEEIEPRLHLVSQAARDEWTSLQDKWPSDEQLREGAIALAEAELEAIETKVRRFRDIVRSLVRPLRDDVEPFPGSAPGTLWTR